MIPPGGNCVEDGFDFNLDTAMGLTASASQWVLNTAMQLGAGVGLGIVASLFAGGTGTATVGHLQVGFLTCITYSAGALLLASRMR